MSQSVSYVHRKWTDGLYYTWNTAPGRFSLHLVDFWLADHVELLLYKSLWTAWGLYCLLGVIVMFTHYRASDQLNIHPTVHVNHTATIHVKHLVYTIDLVYKFEWNDSNRLITITFFFFCLPINRQARKLEPCQIFKRTSHILDRLNLFFSLLVYFLTRGSTHKGHTKQTKQMNIL